jgi:hypothetical protein
MGYGSQTGWKDAAKMKWDETSVAGRKVPPAGSYTEARIEKATPKLSKEKQVPMIEAQVKLLATDNSDIEEGIDCLVFDNWMFSDDPKANFRAKNFAMVAEIELPDSNSYDDVKAFAEEAVGKIVAVEIKGDSYQGRPTAKVDFYGSEPPSDEPKNGKGRPSASAREEKRSSGREERSSGRRR